MLKIFPKMGGAIIMWNKVYLKFINTIEKKYVKKK